MGSESLPEWALLALEKRARLLESALTDENTKRFLELEQGQEGQVLQELQQATEKAANSEFTRTPQIKLKPTPVHQHHSATPAPPMKQPSPIAIPQKMEPTVRKAPIPANQQQQQSTVTRPTPSQLPVSSFQFPPPQPPPQLQRPPSMQQPHNMHQMPFSLLNPFIVQPAMFNTPEQYERFLTLQEEQIRIAREQIELQKSLNLSNFNPLLLQSPVSPYQQTGLLMPFQAAAATTIAAPPTPPSSPTKPVYSSFPSQVQQSQAPPPEVSITEAVQRINRQPSHHHHPLSSNNNNTVTAPTSTLQNHSSSDSSQPTQVNPSPIHHPPSEPTEKVKKRATPVVVVDESSTPQIREMIEHEAINKRGALAMFKALESNQPVPPPVYQSQPTKSFLKPKTTTTTKPKPMPAPVEPPKSILKQRPQETQQAQATPQPSKQQQQLVKPDVLKESENQRGDLDDCRNVSVSNIKSQWGTVASAPAPPPPVIIDEEEDEIVEESNNNDDFDLMAAHEEPVLTSFKPRPEDFQKEKKQESHIVTPPYSDSEESLDVDTSYVVNHQPPNQDHDLVSLQSVTSTTLNDPDDIRRLVLKHLPDVAPKPPLEATKTTPTISQKESEEILEAQLNERRKTIEEVRTIQSDLDEMTRKANAAISIMNDSKTFQVNPNRKEPSKQSTSTEAAKIQPDIIEQASENERAYAEENARLEDEIRAAQAVLASMKPNVKPKGTSTTTSQQKTPQKPDRVVQQVSSPPVVSAEAPKAKKRAPQPKGKNTISIEPDMAKSQYARVGNNFIADREGYVNEVMVEGAGVIRNGGIVKREAKNTTANVQFYPEATELTYPCEIDAVAEWDEQHTIDQVEPTTPPPQPVIKNQPHDSAAPPPRAMPRKKRPPPPPPPQSAQSARDRLIDSEYPYYRVTNLRKTFITPF